MDVDVVDDVDVLLIFKVLCVKLIKFVLEKSRDDSDDDVRFDVDDDIDVFFVKVEKKNKNKFGVWDEFFGDGIDFVSVFKFCKKFKKILSLKKFIKKR